MTQNNGLDILLGWLIFAGLLIVLAAIILRQRSSPDEVVGTRAESEPERVMSTPHNPDAPDR